MNGSSQASANDWLNSLRASASANLPPGITWYNETENYIQTRVSAIADRLHQSFRYVELHPENKNTFSYEYASLLRDIGSVFDSVLGTFLDNIKEKKKDRYDIGDFVNFLFEKIPDLEKIGNIFAKGIQTFWVFPFKGYKKKNRDIGGMHIILLNMMILDL